VAWRAATPDDPVLRELRDLPRHRDGALVVVEGFTAVSRAIAAGWPVHAVLATEEAARHLPSLAEGTAGRVGPPQLLREVVGFDFHRGCIALAARDEPRDVLAWIAERAAADPPWRIVVAEALADPVNVGALIRNARAFGTSAVVLVGGADPFSARAVRASMGHVFAQPLVRAAAIAPVLDAIARACPRACIVAAAIDGVPLDAFAPAPCTVLLLGAEGPGLSAEARARAHASVAIPMAPGVDSLNVAAASAVLLWSLRS